MGVSKEKKRSTTEELFRSSPLGSKSSTLTACKVMSNKLVPKGRESSHSLYPLCSLAIGGNEPLSNIGLEESSKIEMVLSPAIERQHGQRLLGRKTYSGAYKFVRLKRDLVARYKVKMSSIGVSGGWLEVLSSSRRLDSSRSVKNRGTCVSTKSPTISSSLEPSQGISMHNQGSHFNRGALKV